MYFNGKLGFYDIFKELRPMLRITGRKLTHVSRVMAGKFAFALIIYAMCAVSSISLAEPSLNAYLCLQSFNAYGPSYARNLKQRTDTVGDYLQLNPCQIIQLQEVWTESHHDWAMTAIQRSLPFLSSVRFDHFQNPSAGSSGLSTFTSEIITDQQFEAFRVNSDGLLDNIREIFGVIKGIGSSVITIRANESARINLLNVHLHPTSQQVRLTQIIQLIERVESILETSDDPIMITGDFNFTPDSAEYGLLKNVLRLSDTYVEANGPYTKDTCTYCASNPHHWPGVTGVIDYIWSLSRPKIRILSKKSLFNMHGLLGVVPSDHLGIRSYIGMESRNPKHEPSSHLENRIRLANNAVAIAISILHNYGSTDERYTAARQKLASIKATLNELPLDTTNPIIENLTYE